MHKCKEFCGRAWGLRVQVDEGSAQITPNPWLSETVLVIDGTFTDGDLRALARSGWDTIMYPDEVPTFVERLSDKGKVSKA
ncbi:MAG: hypothetical protein GTO63_23045 [Anaerolineae bacterium]|nr:hypothetical protein [Anaerolineae bacterium]NIQ80567.1 hypothetical protein [Anaerolineae bacterium]